MKIGDKVYHKEFLGVGTITGEEFKVINGVRSIHTFLVRWHHVYDEYVRPERYSHYDLALIDFKYYIKEAINNKEVN